MHYREMFPMNVVPTTRILSKKIRRNVVWFWLCVDDDGGLTF